MHESLLALLPAPWDPREVEVAEKLKPYRARRNFRHTPEPRGRKTRGRKGDPRWVIQEHAASSHHFDFRLEDEGVLRSWAVPKGPSTDPREKRLAMQVEDHPLDYFDFEGVIPSGYGAGTVIVWDSGTYRNLGSDPEGRALPVAEQLARGRIAVWLEGEKLRGGYSLVRVATGGESNKWLLIKQKDEEADARRNPVSTERQSVKSGRTLEEVAEDEGGWGGMKREVEISKPEKVLFPKAGITKADLAAYYERIAPYMLPHLRDRLISMQCYPDGIAGHSFIRKDVPGHFPDWIRTERVEKEGGTLTQVVVDDVETLLYLAGQACITPHMWLSRTDDRLHPDVMVFDFDPTRVEPTHVRQVTRAAVSLLSELGLVPFVMTSGSRGYHVHVPLTGEHGFDEVRAFARDVAQLLVSHDPRRLTVETRKDKRQGKIFVDVLRNGYAQTTVVPYAVRAREGAPVATPLSLAELSKADLYPQKYTMANLFRRLARKEDPWQGMSSSGRGLAAAWRALGSLLESEAKRRGEAA